MGSPFGPNFYMGYIENEMLKIITIKPSLNTRYVDDIFVVVENENQLQELKNKFQAKIYF